MTAVAEAPVFLMVTLLAIWLTYLGFGSILLWAFRFAWVQLGALGTLMSRALPLLMLTVVVYFTGELWQLAARWNDPSKTLADNRFPRTGGTGLRDRDHSGTGAHAARRPFGRVRSGGAAGRHTAGVAIGQPIRRDPSHRASRSTWSR